MDTLLVLREHLQRLYARYAKYVDKVLQFVLGLFVFGLLNMNIGYMKSINQPLVVVALALICTFLPMVFLTIAATVVILLHLYTLSLPILIVVAVVFLVMYIFYFRLTPGQAVIILLTPIAFALKIPFIIPIVFGLLGAPVYIIPIAFGTVIYYILAYVKSSATAIKGSNAEGILGKIVAFANQIFKNKEMYVVLVALILCLLVVYAIRKMSIDYAWKIAIGAGILVNVNVIVMGDMVLDVHTSYGTLIVGSILAAAIAFVIEFFMFNVDYSRSENIQFEDDEYVYYVKAVPKIAVAAPEKLVKKINERQETASIDTEMVKKSQRSSMSKTDELLLTKNLQEELDIQELLDELEK